MKTVVGVTRGNDKFTAFDELLAITGFDSVLVETFKKSGKEKDAFAIVIKPNMMVFVNPVGHTAVVTDKELVEYLVDHIRIMGFTDISLCEAQHDVGRMLKNHNVEFVARQIGYAPRGRYSIVDLTLESRPYAYEYRTREGHLKKWKDVVGVTWRDADFRISFAKCKTHEHDWMTLSVKNIYGCFPSPNKVEKYHMKSEVWTVTSYSIRNFPVHFAFVDAWTASDGFQGYKIPHPKELKMLFGGPNAVAVDMEIIKRAGLYNEKADSDKEKYRSHIINRSAQQLFDGVYPVYEVKGDTNTRFSDIVKWKNISNVVVRDVNRWEEIYIAWGLINLKVSAQGVDYDLFPPKNIFLRFVAWLSKFAYAVALLIPYYRKMYATK
jgi:uncharacterized protein (DUF362 family)